MSEKAGYCRSCKHFQAEERMPRYGSCDRWHVGYGVRLENVAINEVLVENDEGWGMLMGEEFGCVLHERKS